MAASSSNGCPRHRGYMNDSTGPSGYKKRADRVRAISKINAALTAISEAQLSIIDAYAAAQAIGASRKVLDRLRAVQDVLYADVVHVASHGSGEALDLSDALTGLFDV